VQQTPTPVCPGQPAAVFFTAVNIRKFVLRAARLRDLVELGGLTPPAAAFLEASVRAGLNILVAGGTQAGNPTTP
jgi:pilus assembly protein CpaF